MDRGLLDVAHALLAAALGVTRKARIPGDHEDAHEDNTFGLPNGNPIRRRMQRYFRDQLKRVVGHLASIGDPLDAPLPLMSAWDAPMAEGLASIIGVYWDRAGRGLRERIGLDPDDWRVTDPHLRQAIEEQSLKFCRSTNATTDLGLAEARDAVRDQLARGLIVTGDTIPELTRRVRGVFAQAGKSRATMIARSEAARAVHAAAEMSAQASGVVTAKRWLLSANSCPICVDLASRSPEVALGGTFAVIGHDVDYSAVHFPPAHPNCRCSITFVLIDESRPDVPAFLPRKARP